MECANGVESRGKSLLATLVQWRLRSLIDCMQRQTQVKTPFHVRRSIRHRGFTLVELLVVISIVAVLAAIIGVTMPRFIERSRAANCMKNLRQMGIVMNGFATENNGFFPVGGNPDGFTRRLCRGAFVDEYPDTGGPKDAPFFEQGGSGSFLVCPSHEKGVEDLGKSYLGNSYILGVKKEGEWLNASYVAKPLSSIYDPSRAFLVIEDWSKDKSKLWRGNGVRYKPKSDAANFAAHGPSRHYLYVDGHVDLITQDPAIGNETAFKINYRGEKPN